MLVSLSEVLFKFVHGNITGFNVLVFYFPSFKDQIFSLTVNTLTKISFWGDVCGEK